MRVLKQLAINSIIAVIIVGSFLLMNYQDNAAPVFRANRDGAAALRCSVPSEDFNLHFVLKSLEEADVNITFFVEYDWVKNNPELCNKIAASGNEIGILGKGARQYNTLSYDETYKELREVRKNIQAASGFTPRLFSPYAGDYNQTVLKAAKKAGLETVLWSVEAVYRKGEENKASESVAAMRVQNVKSGDIINLKPEALQDLGGIVEWLKANHIQPVTVGQLLWG